MDKAALLSLLTKHAPSAAEAQPKDPKWVVGGDEPRIVIASADIPAAAAALKNAGFDLLTMLTAVDWVKENRFELVYYFQKSSTPTDVVYLKSDLPREGTPAVPSLALMYDAADWQERETYDLFGIRFEGHPDHRRILLWEGYPGWPLRKDYVHTPDLYDNGHEVGLPKTPAAGAAS